MYIISVGNHTRDFKIERVRFEITSMSPLATHQPSSDMNELTQEGSPMHASIVKSLLVSYQTASNMKRDMQEPAL